MPKSSAWSLIFLVSPPQLVLPPDAASDDHVPDGAGAGVEGAVEGMPEGDPDAVPGVGLGDTEAKDELGAPGAVAALLVPPVMLVLPVLEPGIPCHCSTGGMTP
jgi:hypothetical protein